VDQLTSLSLCSGGAGLDLGLQLVFPIRTICWVEWEAFAIEYLAQAMEAGCLDQAPIWTDLRTFDGKPWRGTVDCLTAGYPCQPFSLAGKRRGQDDPRHLWPHVRRVIGEVEPAIVFLENVSGHLSLGFEQVATDLEGLGYEVAAGLFSAEEVGASQRRERLFILAIFKGKSRRPRLSATTLGRGCGQLEESKYQNSQEIVGNRKHSGLEEWQGEQCHNESQCASIERAGLPLFAPGPAETDVWFQLLEERPELAPALESKVRGVVDGLARTKWLRLLGNGVVPLQAAYAFCSLWAAMWSNIE
jgi:DNA (cytosine-5)-methyltransferase 1